MCVRQQEKWGLATSDQHHPDEGVAENKLRHYARVWQPFSHTHARNNIITRPLVHLGVREEILKITYILRVNKQKCRKTKQQHRKHVEESGRGILCGSLKWQGPIIYIFVSLHHHESSTTRVCCCPVFACWLPKWDTKPSHLPPEINFRKFSKRLFVFM